MKRVSKVKVRLHSTGKVVTVNVRCTPKPFHPMYVMLSLMCVMRAFMNMIAAAKAV